MTSIYLNLFCFLFTFFVWGQDNIILQSGEEMSVKITEVTEEVIKYKKMNFLDGPNFTLSKKDIFMIKYSNGDKEVFQKIDIENSSEKTQEKEKAASSQFKNEKVLSRNYGLIFGLNFPLLGGRDKDLFNQNLENVVGSTDEGIYLGYKIGGSVIEERLSGKNKKYVLGADLYLETKGYKISDNSSDWIKDDFRYLTLTSFVQVFKIENKESHNITFDLGLFNSFLLNARTTISIDGIENSTVASPSESGLRKHDTGLIIGFSWNSSYLDFQRNIKGKSSIQLKFMPSLLSIYDDDFSSMKVSLLNPTLQGVYYF